MSDYSDSKSGVGSLHPENGVAVDGERLEPLIDFDQVVSRHLFGIPLVSQMKDPNTGKPIVMSPESVVDIIEGAVRQVEECCHIDISPVQRKEKHPFDRAAYNSYGFFKVNHRPASSIERISVTPANGREVFSLPLDWVETAYLGRGQINIIPMTAAFIQGAYIPAGTTGGVWFMHLLGNKFWVPAYWEILYTSGYPDTMVPRVLNDLVGTVAAQEILSMLAATYARNQGHSLGIDGLSQSVSTPGPNIFQTRMAELAEKRKRLEGKIKAKYGMKLFSSHV